MSRFASSLPSRRWVVREPTAPTRRYGAPRPHGSGVAPRRRDTPEPATVPGPHAAPGLDAEARPPADSSPRSSAPGLDWAPGLHADPRRRVEPLSVSDPFDDAEALEELGDEIATLAAHIHAATHRLLLLIADFDRRRGWKLGGHRTCAHWLAYRTGMALGAARERVRTARSLGGLPRISGAMARGQLSFSKVRALSRVATADNEAHLLACAQGATTAQLERMVRGYRLRTAKDEVERERLRHRDRTFSAYPDVDGMVVVRGRLTPELGALLMRAIEAAGDALYREEQGGRREAGATEDGRPRDSEREAARRRADALGLLAERALGAGFGEAEAPVSGSRAEHYQVVLHVDAETLGEGDGVEGLGPEQGPGQDQDQGAGWGPAHEAGCGMGSAGSRPGAGRSELDDGTRVSAETSRRLSCDAGRVVMRHGPGGSILDVGRRSRTVPPALRRALEARDQGCRFPGCGLRFTEGHHVVHWAQGGKTKLENLVLLCRHHHRLLHEEGWSMQWWGEGRPAFFDPRGGIHFDGRWQGLEGDGANGRRDEAEDRRGRRNGRRDGGGRVRMDAPPVGGNQDSEPAGDGSDDLAAALVRDHQRRGVRPGPWTASARWKQEAEIPDDVYFPAMEALGETAGPGE